MVLLVTGCKDRAQQGGAEARPPIAKSSTETRLPFSGEPIEVVLAALSNQTGTTITACGRTRGQLVNLSQENKHAPVERQLDMIVKQQKTWLWYRRQDQPGTYEIWDQESFKNEALSR